MAGYPGLELTEVADRLMARCTPAAERPPCDAAALREQIEASGYGQWYLFDDRLATLAARCNASVEPFEVAVAERRDGSYELEVAADGMTAWVTLKRAWGGQGVAAADLLAALGAAGVVFGIDEAALRRACDDNPDGRVVAAAGQPAQRGEDTRFETLVADSRDRTPRLDERGMIDFRELGAIPTVQAGAPLMRRTPPTAGVAGRNIRGELLPATPGRDLPFADPLAGAAVAAGDPDLLCATCNGQPVRLANGVAVEQVLRVGNVSVASGNITFDGTVQVDGDVLPGMKVHATGDIVIAGTVDGAELEAGGHVQVAGGIIAQARVKAGADVSARFVEGAHVCAGATIAIDDMALQSDLQAMNQILVGIKSAKRGRLVGGSARAMMLIRTPLLGAANGGATSVLVGVNPVLEARYQDLLQRIEKQKADEDNLQKLVQHLTKHGDTKGLLERARNSWQKAVQAWAQLLPERDEVEKELALVDNARVEVGIGVAGVVDLAFGKKALRLRHDYDPGAFLVAEEHIVFVAADGTARPAA